MGLPNYSYPAAKRGERVLIEPETVGGMAFVPWSDDAAEALAPALHGDGELVAQEVREGVSALVHWPGLYLVIRWEYAHDGLQLVLVAVGGKGLHKHMPHVLEYGWAAGMKSWRAHTRHKGIIRMLQRYGGSVAEYVIEGGRNG